MVDKPPSLRQRFLRGRHKPTDTPDNSDSASDKSCTKLDFSNSSDSLSPAQPVARPASRSPSARVPKKLQKKRSIIHNSSAIPTPPMASSEQLDKSPSGDTTEPAVTATSGVDATDTDVAPTPRADARRKERRQLAPVGPRSSVTTRSRKQNESAASVTLNANSDPTFSTDVSSKKDRLTSSLRKKSNEKTRDDASMRVSPLSIETEPDMSDAEGKSSNERRRSVSPAPSSAKNSIENPDYNDPTARGIITAGRAHRRKRSRDKARTPSPVSPPRDHDNEGRNSPVSSLDGSPKGSFKDDEAPLLQHERMESPKQSVTVVNENASVNTNAARSTSPFLEVPRPSRLHKKPSMKSRIPTPKINTTFTDDITKRDGSKVNDSDREGDSAGSSSTSATDIHLNAVAAENALLETLRRITSKKPPQTDTEIRAATKEVLRTAASVLDLGPRSPISPVAPVLPSPSSVLPLLPAPEVPESSTSPPSSLPYSLSRHNSGGSLTMISLQEESDGDTTEEDDDETKARIAKALKKERFLLQQPPVGSERVRHPVAIAYDRPIILASGIVQKGFRRWKCCRCHKYTHYENNVCSKLDCLHVRCEGRCEAFEP